MEKSFNCYMVNSIAKKAIHDLKFNPERTVRNLIDMALQFTDSRFQKEIYSYAQNLLSNEKSAYYSLVKETLTQIDEETLLTFCMNLGYHGLYEGSMQIREAEKTDGYSIPWTIFLTITKGKLSEQHHRTIERGEKMGIHIWHLFSDHGLDECITLAEKHPDSSFAIFCDSGKEVLSVLENVINLRNISIIVPFDEDADIVCHMLQLSKILYGLYYTYTDKDLACIVSGELLHDMEQLHPALSILIPQFPCQKDIRNIVCNWVKNARLEQQFKTLPWEIYSDTLLVDKVISDQAIWVGFDQYGQLNTDEGVTRTYDWNIFVNDLPTILKQAFPKQRGVN